MGYEQVKSYLFSHPNSNPCFSTPKSQTPTYCERIKGPCKAHILIIFTYSYLSDARQRKTLKRWLGGVGGVGWWVGRHCSMARGGFHDLLLMSRLLRSPSEACALSHLGVVIHYGITKECHFRMSYEDPHSCIDLSTP